MSGELPLTEWSRKHIMEGTHTHGTRIQLAQGSEALLCCSITVHTILTLFIDIVTLLCLVVLSVILYVYILLHERNQNSTHTHKNTKRGEYRTCQCWMCAEKSRTWSTKHLCIHVLALWCLYTSTHLEFWMSNNFFGIPNTLCSDLIHWCDQYCLPSFTSSGLCCYTV